ncbi:hypothetical protein LCGC14_1234560 [marine sediment metagenome]|uniref:Uncharacterized protein n=1 Tax=marine sediment metagenome TaxID=412755 RepID=A0A0F9LBR3_9ZZZZ
MTIFDEPLAHNEIRLHILEGGLVVTVLASSVWRCANCEDYHILLLHEATGEALAGLAGAIIHLADHIPAEEKP